MENTVVDNSVPIKPVTEKSCLRVIDFYMRVVSVIDNVDLAWWHGCANAYLPLGLLGYALACKDAIWHGLKSDFTRKQ